jgi:hypothetical protein
MHPDIRKYHAAQAPSDRAICELLHAELEKQLKGAESRVWHAHPVWFLDGNPIAGYSKLKDGVRLMFWSGASFAEEGLTPGTGKFKDASITYADAKQVRKGDLKRWCAEAREVQWDYRNLVKRKGKLARLKP